MQLITTEIEESIHELLTNKQNDGLKSALLINSIIEKMYALIPDNKRISYGIVHTVKVLSNSIFDIGNKCDSSTKIQNPIKESSLRGTACPEYSSGKKSINVKTDCYNKVRNDENEFIDVFEFAKKVFENSSEYKSRSVALGIITNYGLKNHKDVIVYFERSAVSDDWVMREMTQMFFKKLIKKYPDEMKQLLLQYVKSENPYMRRFVSETLRPVQENKWFYKNPDYSLEILRHLFKEKNAYARTSVGNNLSDLSRHLPDLIKKIVSELVESGDKNSYWIAYRACRNMVKKNPAEIMKLLKSNDYKYKDRIYKK